MKLVSPHVICDVKYEINVEQICSFLRVDRKDWTPMIFAVNRYQNRIQVAILTAIGCKYRLGSISTLYKENGADSLYGEIVVGNDYSFSPSSSYGELSWWWVDLRVEHVHIYQSILIDY